MNRYAKWAAAACAVVCVFAACVSAPANPPQAVQSEDTRGFSDALGKNWNLIDVRVKPHEIIFEREKLEEEGFRDIFTLRFDTENIGGIGAPNRYSAPYTLGDGQAITINAVRATLMAPLHEPEKLKERDYFLYLQNTIRWNFAGENLELHTQGEDGTETALLFAPAD